MTLSYEQLYERERDSLLYLLEENQQIEYRKQYHAKTIQSGSQIEVQLYEVWDTKSKNKGKAKKPSKRRQEKLNQRNSQLNFVRLINENFTEKDTWMSLTYDIFSLPADYETAVKNIKNYIIAVKRKWKDRDVKYAYSIEYGEGRCHHHLFINISDRDTLEEMWCSASERARKRKNPAYRIHKYGRTQARRLQADDFGFTGAAMYTSKESKKNKKKYVCSKNLRKPKETKTKTRKGRRLTRRFVKKLAEDKRAAKMELLKLFPDCQFNDIDIRQTPYTKGYYLYARLKRIDGASGTPPPT